MLRAMKPKIQMDIAAEDLLRTGVHACHITLSEPILSRRKNINNVGPVQSFFARQY
jgi:hypothetical protein